MNENIKILDKKDFPLGLSEIPQCPDKLFIKGELPDESFTYLTVVGARRADSYGEEVCKQIIEGLMGYKIAIVSGLALGIDGFAHRSAIRAGLPTIAVPGSGLGKNVLYPRSHLKLAEDIQASGGALLSEFPPDFRATPYSFPQRNRLMAGMSKAVLVIEAEEKSGTLITARLALDYNREVLAVPGSIFSRLSSGTNKLLKQGATPVVDSNDVLDILGFEIKEEKDKQEKLLLDLNPREEKIIQILKQGEVSKDELVRQSGLSVTDLNISLMTLEIKNLISERQGKIFLHL